MRRRSRDILWGGVGLAVGFVLWRGAVILSYKAQGTGLLADAPELTKGYVVGAGRPVRMVILGDSTAVGIGSSSIKKTMGYVIASRLSVRVTVTNLAVSGAILRDVVEGQLPKVPQNADLVLVSATANDATKGTSPSDLQDDLRNLFQGLRERGANRVVLSTTPNFRTTPALPLLLNRLFERRAAELTLMIPRMAAKEPNVRLADLNIEGTLTEEQYAADGFHPNDVGYAAWAEVFVNALHLHLALHLGSDSKGL